MIKLLTGNEAIAEGAIESGVEVVSGYPGTPSTDVILILLHLFVCLIITLLIISYFPHITMLIPRLLGYA